ncbi:MAG: YitT family protein [Chitinophagales bacterium]|nr:YitT family protein [Bacteroidota bacterium]MCB9042624.1 YitT family protein [Chitinophagales bacterium]
MNPFFQQFIAATTKLYSGKRKQAVANYLRLEKHEQKIELAIRHEIVSFLFILAGTLSATWGLKAFLLPNGFIDGGVTGISLIIEKLTQIPLAILIVLINLPFLLLAFKAVSVRFAVKSILAISILALWLYILPFKSITNDKILIAAFGGFFLGLGIGLAIRGGAIIDGTEVLAIYLHKKTDISVGSIILVFNLIIFSIAALIFSTEIALYAILTYIAASKTVDYVIDGFEEYLAVTIISEKSMLLRWVITEKLGLACTIYKGENGYYKQNPAEEIDIIFTVISRLEMAKLKKEIRQVDAKAFVSMHKIADTKGGMIRQKPIHQIH